MFWSSHAHGNRIKNQAIQTGNLRYTMQLIGKKYKLKDRIVKIDEKLNIRYVVW